MRIKRLLQAARLLVLCLLFASVAPVTANDWRVDNADRIVAISDVHGAYGAMVETLRAVGIIDDKLAWSGGTARLVIVGDLLDRGPRSRDAMDLLMRLEPQAQAAGGYIHVLIGNHESMNMLGDMRYVSKQEYAAFAADETEEQRERWARAYVRRQPMPRDVPLLRSQFDEEYPPGYFALRKAFGPDGKYGSWLLQKPLIAVINGTAFVHGGLSPVIAEYGLDGVNTTLRGELAEYVRAVYTLMEAEILLPTDSQYDYASLVQRYMPKLDDSPELLAAVDAVQRLDGSGAITTDGPLWYRSNVSCGGIIEEHRLEAALEAIGAERVVVGHTPTRGRTVQQRFDGRLIEIDTGMLNFYYKGVGSALVLNGDAVIVHEQGGGDPYEPLVHQRSVGARPHNMPPDELENLLRTGEVVSRTNDRDTGRTIVQISDGDHLVAGLFERRSSRGFYPDLAAYRLDRLLNLDMVPVTVRREINGRDGTVQFFPPKAVDEVRRAARNYGLGASCPLGDQLMAMYAFDSLVYNEGRTRERMLYDTRTWSLVLVEHERAFTAKRGRPRHLEEAGIEFSEGWREALQSLGDDVLAENLSDVLDKRRLSALRARRDEILAEIAAAERR